MTDPQTAAAQAVWIEGDPLMEAIASAVWGRCARDDVDMPQLVLDDPRNIAAVAAAVARAMPSAPVDRAAVLAEPADHLAAQADKLWAPGRTAHTVMHADADELRRLAAEAPTTTKPATKAAADRDTLRRRFGDVLRHWGLLDEQIDQKAAEEFVVTDLLALLPAPMDQGAEEAEDDGEGDVLVCVDMCGSCDACGMEPFGTPAEGWRQAARFLRRTARDSGNRRGALHGAQLIEDELRRLAEAEQGAAVLRRMAAEEQPATCGAREPEPRTGTSPCVLPAGHGGTKHQDKWTNQWAAGAQPTTGHEVEATTRGGILVEAIEVARQESERLAAEMSGDAAYGARAVAKVLLRRLVGEEQPQSTQDDGIHEPGCASQSYPDPGICYCEDPQ